MEFPTSFTETIKGQTLRTLWSLNNVIDCIPDSYWEKEYCEMPLWKHVYHTLHSLDMWYINPMVYDEPVFHSKDLNNLDVETEGFLSKALMGEYYCQVKDKIIVYLDELSDECLLETPPNCPYTRFNLILAQHRHLDMHIGMLMGYIIAGEGLWPQILGLQSEFLTGDYSRYF